MSASQRTKRSDLWRVKKEEMSSGERVRGRVLAGDTQGDDTSLEVL